MPTAFVVRERVPSFRKELLVALRGIAGCLPAAAGPRRGDPDHAAARLGPRAPVAQGIERAPPEREVAGSIPARRIETGLAAPTRMVTRVRCAGDAGSDRVVPTQVPPRNVAYLELLSQ